MRVFMSYALLLLASANGQAPSDLAQDSVIKLQQVPDLAPDLEAMPRVLAGPGVTPAVAAIVNRHLAALDRAVLKEVAECRRDTRASHMESDYEREVKVTMRGPRFLSLYTTDEYDCGGPHPDDYQVSLTYDLQTGSPINWLAYLPQSARAETDSGPNATRLSYVVWAALDQISREQAPSDPDRDCQALFKPGSANRYNLNLESNGKILFTPILTPHFDSALCAAGLEMDQTTAHNLGVSPSLLDILSAAAKTKQ